MIDMPLDIFLAYIALIGAASLCLGLLVLRLTLTRRLKKKLKETGDYWDSGTLDFGFFNTTIFAWACTMPWFRKLKKYQLLYPGLDVKSFANWFERAVAYGAIYGLIVFCVIAPLSIFLEP